MNIYYAKTMLYAYPNIEAIMEQIDEIVERKAFFSINDFSPALEQCQKIINLTEQKDALIQLKIYMDEALKYLTKYEMDCFEYKFFKRLPKEYFKDFDGESRKYFRKQVSLIDKFIKILTKVGVTDEWFIENCLITDFFRELLKRVIEKEGKDKKNKSKKTKSSQNQMTHSVRKEDAHSVRKEDAHSDEKPFNEGEKDIKLTA